MKIAFLLILVLTSCFKSIAGASDLGGWQNTYWGMPIEELKSEYEITEQPKKNDNGVDALTLKDYKIFDIPFTVTFLLGNGGYLTGVQLMVITSTNLSSAESKIIHALTSKYGEGVVESKQKTERNTTMHNGKPISFPGISLTKIVWSTPSTFITYQGSVSVSAMPTKEYSSWITISYVANDESKL